MNERLRASFEALLRDEESRLKRLLSAIDKPAFDARNPGEEGEPGAAGAAQPDDAAIAVRESAALAEVEDALRVLRETPELYGMCVHCHRPIARSRLEVVPATRHCGRHANHPGSHGHRSELGASHI